MKYMGSKARHAKEIIPFLMDGHTPDMPYIEPFVGGGNMIDKIPSVLAPTRIGYDVHTYLIKMWQAVGLGWMPPEVFTEAQYRNIRDNKDNYPPELVGYVGFALSYGGKWFGGWRRDKEGKRDYVDEAYRNAAKQFPLLRGVHFQEKSVFDVQPESASTIYCDPPYAGTTGYSNAFDHEGFYDWCRCMKQEGHRVFVSEYNMPDDFICVWEKSVTSSLTQDTGAKTNVERLFTL